jgi:hypothetical protein
MNDRSMTSNAGDGARAVRLPAKPAASAAREPQPWRAQADSPQDDAYRGSRFAEVRAAMFDNPYQRVWGASGEPPLPIYDVRLRDLLRGVLGGIRTHLFRQASARTVDSSADLRWGERKRGFRRIVHPMGVSLFGRWEITEPTEYSGYFARGSRGLIVGRYSVCCGESKRGEMRSLALAGKLFPTTDPEHPEPLVTASFLTQQDIGGDSTEFINDVELRNAPDTTAVRRGFGLATLALTGVVFAIVDKRPTIRQLYSIAELGKPADQPTHAPEFMRLRVAADQRRIAGAALDFRDEIMGQIYDRGDPTPRRTLRFEIDVSDEGEAHGPLLAQRRTIRNWRNIGSITFDAAVCSYNTDYVLHMHHPSWRADRNDPATATRVGRRRVRGGFWLTELLLGSKAPP